MKGAVEVQDDPEPNDVVFQPFPNKNERLRSARDIVAHLVYRAMVRHASTSLWASAAV